MMPNDDSTQKTASGVQALIDRIRDDGVKAAREEAARIVREAKGEAAAIVAKAKRDGEETERVASARIVTEEIAAREALKLASRDAVKDLGTRVWVAFERHLKRLVSAQLTDTEFLRKVIHPMNVVDSMEFLLDKLSEAKTNQNFLDSMSK